MRAGALIVILNASILAAACATTRPHSVASSVEPTKAYVQTSGAFNKHMPTISKVGIITDVCIRRDEAFTDPYLSLGATERMGRRLVEATKEHLISKGYQVEFEIVPFGCGLLKSGTSFRVAQDIGTNISEETMPLFVSPEIPEDARYREAVAHVLRGVFAAVAQNTRPPSDVFSASERIKTALSVIGQHHNVDAIVVFTGFGASVSGAKSGGQRAAQQFLTGILTLGTLMYSKTEVSFLDSTVGLVSIQDADLLWSNSLRRKNVDPADEKLWDNWPQTLLAHLPAQGSDSMPRDYGHGRGHNVNRDAEAANRLQALRTRYAGANKISVGRLAFRDSGRKELNCRLIHPVYAPGRAAFDAYVTEAIERELKELGIYAADSNVSLNGEIAAIDFDSGTTGTGEWRLRGTFYLSGHAPFEVGQSYPFASSFGGPLACQKVNESFVPAVQSFVDAVLDHPNMQSALGARP